MTPSAVSALVAFLDRDHHVAAWDFVGFQSDGMAKAAARLGLAAAFMAAVEPGIRNLERHRTAEMQTRYPARTWPGPARMDDLVYCLLARAKLYLCPLTGEWRETHVTLGDEAYLGEAGGRPFFILQYCSAGYAGTDTAFAFPLDRTVLYFDAGLTDRMIADRLHHLLSGLRGQSEELALHIRCPQAERRLAVAEMRVPHFGHYVWNAISSWERLLPEFAPSIDIFFLWRDNAFIGPLDDIYPEMRQAHCLYLRDDAALTRAVIETGAFAVFAKNQHLSAKLAKRVTTYATAACPPERLSRLMELRARHRLVVLFGIRTDNRCWLEQEAGFIALARQLVDDLGPVAFVIDGMNSNTTRGWTHQLMSPEEEDRIASVIGAGIAGFAACISTVGASMAESIVASNLCDFFVATAGSGLAKYKWVANKPGVVFANSCVLDHKDQRGAPVRVFETSREGLISSIFVAAASVRDFEATSRPGASHANFTMDWRAIHEALQPLLMDRNCVARGVLSGEAASPASGLTADQLGRFESLGDNCELGFVQRALHVNASGLLRWSIAQPEALSRALENDFSDFYLFENLVPSADDMVRDNKSGLFFHTKMRSVGREFLQSEEDRRAIYQAEKAKMDHLLGRFRLRLRDQSAIFVYKTNDGVGLDRARILQRSIRRHGEASLLIVKLAQTGAQLGTVEYIGGGVYVGYVDKFAPYTKADDISLQSWQKVLDAALDKTNVGRKIELLEANFNNVAEFNYSVHIDPALRFIYFNNPKCACTTVKASLNLSMAARAGQEIVFESIGHVHDRKRNLMLTPHEVGLENFHRMLNDADVFKFCFVRDPMGRICSAYESQLRGASPPLRNLAKRMDQSEDWRPEFADFVSAISNSVETRDCDEHWRLQAHQLCVKQVGYTFIGTFDSVESDLMHVLKVLFGEHARLYDVRQTFKHNQSIGARRLAETDPALLKVVGEAYADDVELYRLAKANALARARWTISGEDGEVAVSHSPNHTNAPSAV